MKMKYEERFFFIIPFIFFSCGFLTVDFKISCEFKNTILVKFGAIPVMSMRNEKNQRES